MNLPTAAASTFHAPGSEGPFIAQHSPDPGGVVLKHGDTGPDGRRFWAYRSDCKNGEHWMTEEKFARRKQAERDRLATPENREKMRAHSKRPEVRERSRIAQLRRRATPEGKRKSAGYVMASFKRDPVFANEVRMRNRLRDAFRRANIRNISSHGKLRDSAKFLVWCAGLLGIDPAKPHGFHIDHLIPLSKWDDQHTKYKADDPENVQWLRAEKNLQKKDKMPTPGELQAHLLLVAQWRSEQSEVVSANK